MPCAFGFLAHVAASIGNGLLPQWVPHIVHANDWHAGPIPLLLAMGPSPPPATVFTVHNLAFQGNFPRDVLSGLGIPNSFLHPDGIDSRGQVSFLKAALRFSDRITTVSPTYAHEALTPEFGCGMDGVLRQRGESFSGILNGIDTERWDPATDDHLATHYELSDMSGKRACKTQLQDELGLRVDRDGPLIGFASRLVHQKMADVMLQAAPSIVEAGAQFAVLGEGDPALEHAVGQLAERYPGAVSARTRYDEALAHRLHASADILLAPARFEPCGLTQMYALRYGTLPVVRNTGGLADTVIDATAMALSNSTATGFVFEERTSPALMAAIDHALTLYRQMLLWRRVQLQGMSQDFSWSASAAKYVALYRNVLGLCDLPAPLPDPTTIEGPVGRHAAT